MILKLIIRGFLGIFLGAFSDVIYFFDMLKAPQFYFQWVTDIKPYFDCIRYIIPLDQLVPLFIAIMGVTLVRITIALIHLVFGKLFPIW